jgi:hypothetical protein
VDLPSPQRRVSLRDVSAEQKPALPNPTPPQPTTAPQAAQSGTVASMVSGMGIDNLIDFIEGNVPPDWAIVSPRGEQTIRDTYDLWLTQLDGDDGAGGEE